MAGGRLSGRQGIHVGENIVQTQLQRVVRDGSMGGLASYGLGGGLYRLCGVRHGRRDRVFPLVIRQVRGLRGVGLLQQAVALLLGGQQAGVCHHIVGGKKLFLVIGDRLYAIASGRSIGKGRGRVCLGLHHGGDGRIILVLVPGEVVSVGGVGGVSGISGVITVIGIVALDDLIIVLGAIDGDYLGGGESIVILVLILTVLVPREIGGILGGGGRLLGAVDGDHLGGGESIVILVLVFTVLVPREIGVFFFVLVPREVSGVSGVIGGISGIVALDDLIIVLGAVDGDHLGGGEIIDILVLVFTVLVPREIGVFFFVLVLIPREIVGILGGGDLFLLGLLLKFAGIQIEFGLVGGLLSVGQLGAQESGQIVIHGGRGGFGFGGGGAHGGLQALRPIHGLGLGVLLVGQDVPSLRFYVFMNYFL
jgi:hypothetical protein